MPPISVLDLSPVISGAGEGQALRDTVELARRAEALGYERYWLAEHHGGAMLASSAPEILIGHVADATERIRVGSGGMMLPNHSPLRIAEQFKVLEALHPGRIDLGIGRAPGTDQMTAMALRRSPQAMSGEDFPEQLAELLRFAGLREWPPTHPFAHVRAAPVETPLPPIYLLGSSDFSAQLAAAAGMGFAFAGQINPELSVDALRTYRERFEPSPELPEPLAILSLNVVCAGDDETAQRLAAPARVAFRRLRAGRPTPLPSVEDALAEEEATGSDSAGPARRGGRPARMIVGSPTAVREEMGAVHDASGADELMVMTNMHALADRMRSYELIAEAWGIEPAPVAVAGEAARS
jgi:luciferase family oxidoreductase group 1